MSRDRLGVVGTDTSEAGDAVEGAVGAHYGANSLIEAGGGVNQVACAQVAVAQRQLGHPEQHGGVD